MQSIDFSAFKAYDIRGLYPDQVNTDVAKLLGQAYVQLLQQENPDKSLNIVVSRDMRPSSEELEQALVEGITSAGANVVQIGLNTTPTFYFAVAYYQHDGGIQITASHNPSEYNGFKLVRDRARPVGEGTGMEDIVQLIKENNFRQPKKTGKVVKLKSVMNDQIKFVSKLVNLDKIKPLKIVVDAGNSVGALDMKAIFKELPCELIPLYFELDGTFPNHDADPLKPENIEDLQKEVLKQKADLGIALDGDGDRMFFVDEKGEEVPQAILRGMMAQIELQNNPGATVCYDIRPGKVTRDMIDEAGGKPVITRVGHSLIKAKMEETGAIFGGESSGHYFYKFEFGTFDTPLVLLVKFLNHISQEDKPISAIVKPYKRYSHSGEINSMVDDKNKVIEKLAQEYADAEISRLDGITITYDDFWFNVRPSNTEPKLRLNLEAINDKIMAEKRDEVLAIIRE
ncbi:MAG: Phosphomannomutase [Microgenomates bacterium 39_7]|nr:MAG: Phosphomannomutase [Microgenomates bacterium 39_7]